MKRAKFTPRLLAFQEATQGPDGPVPDGFLVYVVWEIVPGLRLGDKFGKATPYWETFTTKEERNLIRTAFGSSFK